MKIKKILKWILIIAGTAALYPLCKETALRERGYAAIGGEAVILFIPILYYCIEWTVKDLGVRINDVRQLPGCSICRNPDLVFHCSPNETILKLCDRCHMEAHRKRNLEEVVSSEKTDRFAFRCLMCEEINIYYAHNGDGRTCAYCGGHIIPIGYAKKYTQINA